MCDLCDESPTGVAQCQDCGGLICFDDDTAYVTTSGDLYCASCGEEYDEDLEEELEIMDYLDPSDFDDDDWDDDEELQE